MKKMANEKDSGTMDNIKAKVDSIVMWKYLGGFVENRYSISLWTSIDDLCIEWMEQENFAFFKIKHGKKPTITNNNNKQTEEQ